LSLLESSHQAAIALLQRGHHIDPTNLDILLELIRRLMASGRKEEAIQYCDKAREIASDNPRLQELLRECLDTLS
jgi:tetratricopeptide (TPR) repeat protein